MHLKAILVEDSSTILETLIPAMSEMANLAVIAIAGTASDAVDALDQYAEQWDVVVVDLFLKQGSGLEVLRACQSRKWNQKAIVLTNYATADIRRRCLALGADAIFDKSTELDQFFDLCNSLGSSRLN